MPARRGQQVSVVGDTNMNKLNSTLKSMWVSRLIGAVLATGMMVAQSSLADIVDDALGQDITLLCADGNAQELYKIASKKKNSDAIRREALQRMMEASRECSMASDQRLVQYHHKMINAAHDVITFSEEESRQIAVEAFQFVIQLPDEQQPPEGSISRGNKLAQIALNDGSVNIRLWALEALVTLRGNRPLVLNTLNGALQDAEPVVRNMAADMINGLPN